MNRKIFAILFISVFLIASVGFVSAADDSSGDVSTPIKVKIAWNDDGQTADRPSQITVNLLKDGKVVESVELKASNSWSATFKTQNDGGNYKVALAKDVSSYSISSKGSASNGFVISAVLKETPMRASGEDPSALSNSTLSNGTDDVNNSTNNSTNNNTNNSTDNNTSNSTDNTPKKDTSKDTKKVKKDVKPVKKDKHKVNKNKLKNTGIPIVALSLVAMVAVFIPFRNKK